jgi:hypothetical protein
LIVNGGTLELLAGVTNVNLGHATFGSLLNTMNGEIAKVTANELEILQTGDDMEWKLDFGVDRETCDQIKTDTFKNEDDKPLVIPSYAVLGTPTKNEGSRVD